MLLIIPSLLSNINKTQNNKMTIFTTRRTAMEHVAVPLKMEYAKKDHWSIMPLLEDFHLFQTGRRKKIRNLLYKKDAWNQTNLYIFDYHYLRHYGNNHKQYQQTVFFIQSKQLALPEFQMKPETFFHQIAAFLGYEDIDFEAHPEFSKNYYLKSNDEEWMRSIFHKELIEFFTIEKDWILEGVGYFLILYKKNQLIAPQSIQDFYHRGLKVCKLLENRLNS